MSESKRETRGVSPPHQPEHHEWVKVGTINNDADAELIASLFEYEGVPCVIHGRNHRRMLGFLGGQVIELRLLVPRARLQEAESLFTRYYEQRAGRGEQLERLTPEDAISVDAERNLIFGSRKKRAAIALFCGLFIGFGSASLIVGAWWFTLVLAPLQLLDHWPALTSWFGEVTGASAEVTHHIAISVPLVDLSLALLALFFASPPQRERSPDDQSES